MSLLRLVHMWVGVTIGCLFALSALTGLILVFEPQIAALASPHSPQVPGAYSTAEIVRITEGVSTRYRDFEPHRIVFPTKEVPVVTVWLRDQTFLELDPKSLDLLSHKRPNRDPLSLLGSLHARFLLPGGDLYVGLTGLAVLGLMVSGCVLWLRHWRLLSLRHLVPGRLSGSAFLRSHHTTGIIVVTMLLLPVVTGLTLALPKPAREIARLLDGEALVQSRPQVEQMDGLDAVAQPWPVLVQAAVDALPHASVMALVLPREGQPRAQFQLRLDGKAVPGALSNVYVHSQTGAVLAAYRTDAAGGPLNTFINMAYGLHTGRDMPFVYKLFVFGIGFSGLWLAGLGLLSYVTRAKTRKKGRRMRAT